MAGSRGNRKGRSGNPAKAAARERAAREAARRRKAEAAGRSGLRRRLLPSRDQLELAFSETPAWTRWVAAAGLVLGLVVVALSWFVMTQDPGVGAMAWLLLVVATGGLLTGTLGMVTGRDSWAMAGIIVTATAPTGSLYLVNALTLTCGIAAAWGIARSTRS